MCLQLQRPSKPDTIEQEVERDRDKEFSVRVHHDCVLIDHCGRSDAAAAEVRVPQIQAAMQQVFTQHGRIATIHSLLNTHDIDFPSRSKYVALAVEWSVRKPLWIVVVRNPAFRIIVRVAGLAAGQSVAVASSMPQALRIARQQGYQPDPAWQ